MKPVFIRELDPDDHWIVVGERILVINHNKPPIWINADGSEEPAVFSDEVIEGRGGS